MSARVDTYQYLVAGLPPDVNVYQDVPEQVKVPAVVIGSMTWTPVVMNRLAAVQWSMNLMLHLSRSMPQTSVAQLEDLSLQVAALLLEGGYVVQGLTNVGTEPVGGVDVLTGTLEVTYREEP